jgi:hypothetical protein
VINAEALAYMREHHLAGPAIARLANHAETRFADRQSWQGHLDRLGIAALKGRYDPVGIATEGALWGSVRAHGLLGATAVVSDDAGQFDVGRHGLCWVHAERLVHHLDTFTERQRTAQQRLRALIWRFYGDLKAYKTDPSPRRRAQLRARFDRIFKRHTGFATLDRLLARLHAKKPELLLVLDHPQIPCTPTAPRTTSAARSSGARSAAAPAATSGAIAATPSSARPRPAPSSASPSGITSATASPPRPILRSPTFPIWSGTAVNPHDCPAFCPSYAPANPLAWPDELFRLTG